MRFVPSNKCSWLIWTLFLLSLPVLLIACGSGISGEDLAAVRAALQKAQSEAQSAQTQIRELEKQIVPVNEKAGTTELTEGTIRTHYINSPKVGAKGYVVADWQKGQVRVEVKDFPSSEAGYEVFLFQIDVDGLRSAAFVDGDPTKGVVANLPPMDAVAGLISQWQSIGDLKMDDKGNGVLEYNEGDDLYAKGLNMLMVFGKVTEGQHDAPEDFSKLIVECHGPLEGTEGTESRLRALHILSQ